MSTKTIGAIAKSTVSMFVSRTHPNGLQTSSFSIAKHLDDDTLNRANAGLIAAGRACFPNDKFSADLFEYAFLERFDESQIDIYSAVMSTEGGELGTRLKTASSSTDNLVDIQSQEGFNIMVAPLHDKFTAAYRRRAELKKRLRGAVQVGVIPTADPASWMAAVSWIVHNVKANDSTDAVNKKFDMFISSPLSTRNVEHIKAVKSALQRLVSQADLKGIVNSLADAPLNTQEERENAAMSGRVNKAITWQKIINRMETADRETVVIADYRNASSLASVRSKTADFSLDLASLTVANQMEKALASDGSVLSLERMDSVVIEGEDAEYKGKHMEALVAHILTCAGVNLDLFENTTKAGQGVDTPRCYVPLAWHALADYIGGFTTELWRCFVPESKELVFFKQLTDLASRNGAKAIAVDKETPVLMRVLREDIEGLVSEIKGLSGTGRPLNAEKASDKHLSKFLSYEQEVVSPFDDMMVNTVTKVGDFVRSGVVVSETTRPVGTIAQPISRANGFSEAIVARNKDQFDAITASATMEDVARLYNAVSDYTSVKTLGMTTNFRLTDAIGEALNDFAKGSMRVNDAGMETVMGSEVVADAHFAELGGDFYAFVVERDEEPLLLASGGASVMTKSTTFGNIHGSFTHGTIEPTSPFAIDSAYNEAVIKLIDKAIETLVNGYVPRRVDIKHRVFAEIALKEENDSYAERIAQVPRHFPLTAPLDKQLIQSLVMSPMIRKTIAEVADASLIMFANHMVPAVRRDVDAILNIVLTNQMYTLQSTYSEDVLSLFARMLTQPLGMEDRLALLRPEFSASCNALAETIVKSLKGQPATLRAVYLNKLVTALAALGEAYDPADHIGDEE